jgi:hypothetical protein
MLRKTLAILFIFFTVGNSSVRAQADFEAIKLVEDTLIHTIDSMYDMKIPDDREPYNERVVRQLVRALKTPGSFKYRFDSLLKRINVIYPEDKSFRIFNWAVSYDDVKQRYYGAIQMNSDELKLYPLIDCSMELGKDAEDAILTKGKWYGAVYYNIIPHEIDGRTVYTLFGKNAGGALSNKKLMEPLTFTDTGVVFGAQIFNIRSQNKPTERISRFIIEYKKVAQASINWDKELNLVYVDRLESDINDPNRKYTYVPTGQYDGFRWVDGYWNFVQDLIPVESLKDGQAPTPQPYKGRE